MMDVHIRIYFERKYIYIIQFSSFSMDIEIISWYMSYAARALFGDNTVFSDNDVFHITGYVPW